MGAFAVFGVTHELAREKAEKLVDKRRASSKTPWTADFYLVELAKETQAQFEKMKPLRCSPEYDAPQFANEWKELAKNVKARDLQVRCWDVERDETGAEIRNPKNGRLKYRWQPYREQRS
ncbi:hypothetical protein [Chitinolyticbacter meiyuanensis]|uniref:hypothetical protein n=1 Tax=Chitinolyticbacter meiyuanensis TaxID=682798 RepID=UPI0011E5D559|nr:hypothetical protein [Chitinolyticbacter meiyuanensis]